MIHRAILLPSLISLETIIIINFPAKDTKHIYVLFQYIYIIVIRHITLNLSLGSFPALKIIWKRKTAFFQLSDTTVCVRNISCTHKII